MFVTYILWSAKCSKYYYGHSKDLKARMKRHNNGIVRSTKSCVPWVIHYQESYSTKSTAYKRELFFKSIEGYRYLREEGIISSH